MLAPLARHRPRTTPVPLPRTPAASPARLGHSARHCSLRVAHLRPGLAPAALARVLHAIARSGPLESSISVPPRRELRPSAAWFACRSRVCSMPSTRPRSARANSSEPLCRQSFAILLRPSPAPSPGTVSVLQRHHAPLLGSAGAHVLSPALSPHQPSHPRALRLLLLRHQPAWARLPAARIALARPGPPSPGLRAATARAPAPCRSSRASSRRTGPCARARALPRRAVRPRPQRPAPLGPRVTPARLRSPNRVESRRAAWARVGPGMLRRRLGQGRPWAPPAPPAVACVEERKGKSRRRTQEEVPPSKEEERRQ
jgi:hypothetical protein